MKNNDKKPTGYEAEILKKVSEWRASGVNKFSSTWRFLSNSWQKVEQAVAKIPGLQHFIETTTQEIVLVFSDLSSWATSTEQAKNTLLEAGVIKNKGEDAVSALDLADIEQALGHLVEKYRRLSQDEELALSQKNSLLPKGLPSDIVALVSLNQKAIAECAALYGFQISTYQEKLFALDILTFAASNTLETKRAAMKQLLKTTLNLSRSMGMPDMDKTYFLDMLKKLASTLSIRLVKAKIGETLPLSGAIIGGGFNAFFTDKVLDTATQLYRERYLIEKYGQEALHLPPHEDNPE